MSKKYEQVKAKISQANPKMTEDQIDLKIEQAMTYYENDLGYAEEPEKTTWKTIAKCVLVGLLIGHLINSANEAKYYKRFAGKDASFIYAIFKNYPAKETFFNF